MTRWIAMALLVLGVGIAASSGSRLSPQLSDYRVANGVVTDLQALQAELTECRESDEVDDVETCESKALAPRYESGALAPGQSVDAALEQAVSARDAVGLPTPGQRMVQWAKVGAPGWLFGVVLIVAGAVLARRQQAAEAQGSGLATDEQVHFPAWLAIVRREVDALEASLADLPMEDDAPEIRERIDDLQADRILPIVDARAQFIARHGIAAFAEYFSPFSAGERNLGRCWSALTDGHAVVAREAIERARIAFAEAAAAWDRIEVDRGGTPWAAAPAPEAAEAREPAEAPQTPEASVPPAEADEPLGDPDTVSDPETVSDEESVSDQVTLSAAPDADERELDLPQKEELRSLVSEGIEVVEALVDEPFDIDDSDAVIGALHHAVQVLIVGDAPSRWDRDTAGRLLGLLWGEHIARVAGWRWVRLSVGSRDGYAVVSNDRAHAAYPADFVRSIVREGAADNRLLLVYEMVRDRRVLPAAPGTRTLLT